MNTGPNGPGSSQPARSSPSQPHGQRATGPKTGPREDAHRGFAPNDTLPAAAPGAPDPRGVLEIIAASPDGAFRDITALAAAVCEAPMAALAVADGDTIWFGAATGLLPGPHPAAACPGAGGGPGDAAHLVGDVLDRQELEGHPLVVGAPHVRASAGAPLLTSGGARIGVLCVFDRAPRLWTPAEAASLERLSRIAASLIEGRARAAASAARAADADARRLLAMRFETVFAAVQEGLVLKNGAGEIIEANPSAARLLGLSEDQLRGRPLRDPRWRVIAPGGAPLPAERHPAEIALRTGQRVDNATVGIERPSGERRWLSVSALPLFRDDELAPHQVLMTLVDVTHARLTDQLLKTNQRRLEEALEAAEAASAFKSAFLASMSHEIRTPLNGVIGLASALARSETRPRQLEMISLISSSGEALDRLLGDVFDLSRAEAGTMDLVAVPFRLRDEIEEAAAPLGVRARDKGVGFGLSFEGDAAAAVCLGDAVRLRQVIFNLASNAITFTAKGSVQIAIALCASGAGAPDRLSVSVADTGPGIASATLPALFARLPPASSPTATSSGRTDLGLAISRVLVELLGGELSVTSAPGIGSMFDFWIPVRRLCETDAPERVVAVRRERPLRVLLVEDHPVNRKVVEMLLEPFAMTLTIAEDGLQALDHYESAQYDLVLMDMEMPVMDGLTSVREIRRRETETGRARTPIAMMSANTGPEHRRSAREAGADGFISKPMTAGALVSDIDSLLTRCAA